MARNKLGGGLGVAWGPPPAARYGSNNGGAAAHPGLDRVILALVLDLPYHSANIL